MAASSLNRHSIADLQPHKSFDPTFTLRAGLRLTITHSEVRIVTYSFGRHGNGRFGITGPLELLQ